MAPKAKAVVAVKAVVKPEEEKKRKAEEEAKKEEPAAKEPKKEEPVAEEKKELEKDAPKDARPQIKDTVVFDPNDCTLNVMPTMGGKVMMCLSDGGMQFLIAGARANVGIKSGRYMFEAKVIEALSPAEAAGNKAKVPMPRQLLRIGFSTAGSQLVLGETDDGVCFDAEGAFTVECKKKVVCQRFGKNQTMAVLLNLDQKSPNANTISLFHNGERYCEPQPLPEALKGKTLYPHVSYRNVSVQMNFGANALTPLTAFSCRTLQNAAAADTEVAKASPTPVDGKYEVVFPVAFPDEGSFDWLDSFMEKNPNYVELSDRKIIDWASKSGLVKPKSTGTKHSADKPEFNYGLTAMDDLSIRRVLQAVAPFVPRNYVVMEVKENLTAADRIATLKRFNHPAYKKVAHVVMGEPSATYKKVVQSRILKDKQEKAVSEWKARKAEKTRKKQLELRQKQLADMRKKAEEARKKAAEEKKKKAEEVKKKVEEAKKKRVEEAAKKKAAEEAKKKAEEAKEKGEEGEEAKEEGEKAEEEAPKEEAPKEEETKEEAAEEPKEEETKEEEVKEEAKEEADEEMKAEESEEEPEPTGVELTEEDKKVWFRPPSVSDLTPAVLAQAFGKFTLPEKSEGFDDIKYEWQPAAKANDYLRTWVVDKKLTARMEDLTPSKWSKEKHAAFAKAVKEWQAKQKPLLAKRQAEQKKKAAEKKKKQAESADPDAEVEEEEEEKTEEFDIFAVEDIQDAGNGEPLYVNFEFEDWAMLTLRFELFFLVQAFKKDVDDEDRPGVHESNLSFYYQKYFSKQLQAKWYGKESIQQVVELVKDAATIAEANKVLQTSLETGDLVDTFDIFVKLTEEGRRERMRRIDAGDETARIKFDRMLTQISRPTVASVATTAAALPSPQLLQPKGKGKIGGKGPTTAWQPQYAAGGKGAWGAPAW